MKLVAITDKTLTRNVNKSDGTLDESSINCHGGVITVPTKEVLEANVNQADGSEIVLPDYDCKVLSISTDLTFQVEQGTSVKQIAISIKIPINDENGNPNSLVIDWGDGNPTIPVTCDNNENTYVSSYTESDTVNLISVIGSTDYINTFKIYNNANTEDDIYDSVYVQSSYVFLELVRLEFLKIYGASCGLFNMNRLPVSIIDIDIVGTAFIAIGTISQLTALTSIVIKGSYTLTNISGTLNGNKYLTTIQIYGSNTISDDLTIYDRLVYFYINGTSANFTGTVTSADLQSLTIKGYGSLVYLNVNTTTLDGSPNTAKPNMIDLRSLSCVQSSILRATGDVTQCVNFTYAYLPGSANHFTGNLVGHIGYFYVGGSCTLTHNLTGNRKLYYLNIGGSNSFSGTLYAPRLDGYNGMFYFGVSGLHTFDCNLDDLVTSVQHFYAMSTGNITGNIPLGIFYFVAKNLTPIQTLLPHLYHPSVYYAPENWVLTSDMIADFLAYFRTRKDSYRARSERGRTIRLDRNSSSESITSSIAADDKNYMEAYQSYGSTYWKIYVPIAEVTNVVITVDVDSITIDFDKNITNDDVVVLWNTTNVFGDLLENTSYSVGQNIAGGGTVLANGDITSVLHSGLNSSTTYYYKIVSLDKHNTATYKTYSNGVDVNAVTL